MKTLGLWRRIRQTAAGYGVELLESELVGMAPAQALVDVARQALQFGRLDADAIRETRLLQHTLSSGSE